MPDIDAVRRFAGADTSGGEDPVLEMCLGAAVAWYAGADVPPETEGPDYDYWVANLAAWMYDNRGNADANAGTPGYILGSLHQLRALAKRQLNAKLGRLLAAEIAAGADDGTIAVIESAIAGGSNNEKAEVLRRFAPEDGDGDGTRAGDGAGDGEDTAEGGGA